MHKNNFNNLKIVYYLKNASFNDSLTVCLKQIVNINFREYTDIQECYINCIEAPPDLLLCDIDGIHEPFIELIHQIRTPQAWGKAKFPVLILGTGINERITSQLSDSGVDGVLKKPFNLGLLVNRVNQLLTQESEMVEEGGVMRPLPRIKYESVQKSTVEREVHTWLV